MPGRSKSDFMLPVCKEWDRKGWVSGASCQQSRGLPWFSCFTLWKSLTNVEATYPVQSSTFYHLRDFRNNLFIDPHLTNKNTWYYSCLSQKDAGRTTDDGKSRHVFPGQWSPLPHQLLCHFCRWENTSLSFCLGDRTLCVSMWPWSDRSEHYLPPSILDNAGLSTCPILVHGWPSSSTWFKKK